MIYRDSLPPVPPPTPAELIARAIIREGIAAEMNAAGLYESAKRHWQVADAYRRQAQGVPA